jgi:hypothetical protein
MIQMNTLDELLTKINEVPLALVYLSQPACSVCLADKPRIEKLAFEQHVPLYAIDVVADSRSSWTVCRIDGSSRPFIC